MEMGNVTERNQPNQRAETAKDNQWAFNTRRKSYTQRWASAGPKQKCVLVIHPF